MTASSDPDRRIGAFLEEGPAELSDRVYDAVRFEIDSTPQRAVIGPWRTPDMHFSWKLPIVGAAVVIAAVVGLGVLPHADERDVAAPAASSSPSPLPDPFASSGPLEPGAYGADVDGVRFSFDVPSPGWESGTFTFISKGPSDDPEAAYVSFWPPTFDNVYADPCAHTPLEPAPEATAEGLASAIAAMPGIDLVTGPWSVTIGGRPAQHVVFTVRPDIGCAPNDFYLYYDDDSGGPTGGYRYADALGQTMRVWIVDLGDRLFWVDSGTTAGVDAVSSREVQQIVESLHFE
jgi:hypothetical protein